MSGWQVAADADGRPTQRTCSHLAAAVPGVQPSTEEGCEDCLRTGGTWVHLRECLACGHVACCDSSPNRHASTHARSDEHPLARSFEPGEKWAWCYQDLLLLLPA